jgi:hypothetical protein
MALGNKRRHGIIDWYIVKKYRSFKCQYNLATLERHPGVEYQFPH